MPDSSSRQRGSASIPDTYRLHLPPVRAVRSRGREKVFGLGSAVPLDRNAKATHCRLRARLGSPTPPAGPGEAEPWGAPPWTSWAPCCGVFHNARSGCCFPSYETIAAKSGCARSTVAEAIKALEFAGVLTWQNRITRIRERCRDLFGRDDRRWRVIPHVQRLRVPGP